MTTSKYKVTVVESPVCIAHQLHLPYESKCSNLHGHNYSVEVVITSTHLDRHGMVIDFTNLKAAIKLFDHAVLGVILDRKHEKVFFDRHYPEVEPSTAENFATFLMQHLKTVLTDLNPYAVLESVSCKETASTDVTCHR